MDPAIVPLPVDAPGVVEYSRQLDVAWLVTRVAVIALPLVLFFTGAATRLRGACARLARGQRFFTLVMFAAAWLAIVAIATLPLDYWSDIHIRNAWSRPAPTLTGWLADQTVTLLAQIVAAAMFLWIPFRLMRRLPKSWWICTAAVAWLLVTAVLVVEQVVIRPLTTAFTLPSGPLKAQFDELLARCNASQTLILIGGDDDTAVGLGPTSRILLSENLLDQPQEEIVGTLAHELKHHLLHDNWLAIGLIGVVLFCGALLVQLIGRAVVRRWGARVQVASLEDPAALTLIAAILTAGWTFAGLPLLNAVQRHVEIEADRFAIEAMRDNHARASWQLKEAQESYRPSEHSTLRRLFHATHPSDAERIRLANEWQPWATGQAGRYERVCRPPGERPAN